MKALPPSPRSNWTIGARLFKHVFLCTFFLLAIPCPAQQVHKIASPPRFNRRAFLAEASVLAASQTADAITTRQNLNRGGIETNHVYGSRPSPGIEAGINLGFFAADTGILYLTGHSRHRLIRWAGRAFVAYEIADHAQAAACNASLDPARGGPRALTAPVSNAPRTPVLWDGRETLCAIYSTHSKPRERARTRCSGHRG